jgi:hypothetical protein
MLPVRVTKNLVRTLHWLAARMLSPDSRPERHRIGRAGEQDAYFHLRKLGYTIVARNFRSPRCLVS